MSDATIRTAEARDISDIQRLYRQLDRHHVELLPDVFQQVDDDVREDEMIQSCIDRDDADYLVAELDGRVVGFVKVQQTTHPKLPMFRPREFAMIEDAVVDQPHRGKGIGRTLFAAAIAWVRQRGLGQVQTAVWQDNVGAREFYLGQGFHPSIVRLVRDVEPAGGTGG